MNILALKHWKKLKKSIWACSATKIDPKNMFGTKKKFSEKMVWESKSDENFENFEFLKIVVRRLHDMNKQT